MARTSKTTSADEREEQVRYVMTPDPIAIRSDASVIDAARRMRDEGIGDVIVVDDDRVCGILTDRDIVVRGLAEECDPRATRVADVCSRELTTVRPEDTVNHAVRLMREHAIRRLPVVDAAGQPVGIVSLGDLALERDPDSVLGHISAAPPND
jgi:CBS domain-containing protein